MSDETHDRPSPASGMFVSYAQNFEDVILWNALREHGPGRYLDIGAWDPDLDSVSRAFNERGWEGFHVEPLPEMAARLRESRPGDVVIEAAVDAEPGRVRFHAIPETGLSTLDDVAASSASDAGHGTHVIEVEAVTLAALLDRMGAPVQWLKIDVEGAEERVLRTLSETDVRPWIIAVEATEPGTTVATHHLWESHLTANGYVYAFGDVLNRYYVLDEGPIFPSALRFPGVFDDFTISPDSTALGRAARSAVDEVKAEQVAMRSELDGVVTERDALRVDRDAVAVERDVVVADRDALRAERDAVVADRDRWAEQFQRLRARRSVRVALWFARIVGRVRRLLPAGR